MNRFSAVWIDDSQLIDDAAQQFRINTTKTIKYCYLNRFYKPTIFCRIDDLITFPLTNNRVHRECAENSLIICLRSFKFEMMTFSDLFANFLSFVFLLFPFSCLIFFFLEPISSGAFWPKKIHFIYSVHQ